MNVSGFLRELSKTTTADVFRSTLHKIDENNLNPSDQSRAEKISRWLNENILTLKRDDVSPLFQIKQRVTRFLHASSTDACITTIETICLSLLPTASLNISAHFPNSSKAEIAYFSYLLTHAPLQSHSHIFELLDEVPGVKTVMAIEHILSLFIDVTDEAEISQSYRVLKNIPANQRINIIHHAAPFLVSTPHRSEKRAILNLFSSFPQGQIKHAITTAMPYLTSSSNGLLKATIVFSIHRLPQEHKNPSNIGKLIALYDEIAPFPVLFAAIDRLLRITPPEECLDFIETLIQRVDDTPRTPSVLLSKAYEHVSRQLQKHLNAANFKVAQYIADNIFNQQRLLLLHEDHPLLQSAIHILILTADPAHHKNPFTVYKRLQDEAKTVKEIALAYEVIGGVPVALKPETFTQNAVSLNVTFDQLPKGISPQFLITQFQALKARIDSLEAAKREEVLTQIQENHATSFSDLYNNIVLGSFTTMKVEPKDVVSADFAKYMAISKYLYDQSNETAENALLSAQEELLLTISTSIRGCSKGKKEGSTLYYNNLPAEYKYHSQENANTPDVEKALEYVQRSIQDTLNSLFSSDNAMMKELTGESGAIQQLAHSSTFIKNRIGPRVGFAHELTFDPHTHTLYDSLVEKSLEDTLNIFYKHATPSRFIQELQNQFSRDKMSMKSLITWLNDLIETKLGKAAMDYDTIWVCDEEFTTASFSLTDEGARKVLLAAGYLKEMISSEN